LPQRTAARLASPDEASKDLDRSAALPPSELVEGGAAHGQASLTAVQSGKPQSSSANRQKKPKTKP